MNAANLIDELEQIIKWHCDSDCKDYEIYIPSKNEPMTIEEFEEYEIEINCSSDFPYTNWKIIDLNIIEMFCRELRIVTPLMRMNPSYNKSVNFYDEYICGKSFWCADYEERLICSYGEWNKKVYNNVSSSEHNFVMFIRESI